MRLMIGLGPFGAGAVIGPGATAPVNTTPPVFLISDGSGGFTTVTTVADNVPIFLDVKDWTGTAPLLFRVQLRRVSDNAIVLPFTSVPDVDAATAAGSSYYPEIECTDANGLVTTQTFPAVTLAITASFTYAFVGRYDFRVDNTTSFTVGNIPTNTFAYMNASKAAFSTVTAIAPDSTDWANCGDNVAGFSNRTNNTTTPGFTRLCGRMTFTVASAHFSVQLAPNTKYQVRFAMGDTNAAARVDFVLGAANSGTVALSYPNTGATAGNMYAADGNEYTRSAIAAWANGTVTDGVWSSTFTTDASGILRLQRFDVNNAGTGQISFLDIRTAP